MYCIYSNRDLSFSRYMFAGRVHGGGGGNEATDIAAKSINWSLFDDVRFAFASMMIQFSMNQAIPVKIIECSKQNVIFTGLFQ
jgi:hypothetical protein